MQQQQQQMSKSEWKRSIGSSKDLKKVKAMHKARHKANLQHHFESATGEKIENWDDGVSVGKKEQAKRLRETNKLMQQRWLWLFRSMRVATGVLFVWWFLLVSSFNIDPALRLLFCLFSVPFMYVLASYGIRYHIVWQKRANQQGQYYYVGPPLFSDPPLLALVTLLLMHLTYFAANIIDGGVFHHAMTVGDQSLVQLGMSAFIPSVFGFISVVAIAVVLPNYAAQDCWVFSERHNGEMVQYSVYIGGSLLAAAVVLGLYLRAAYLGMSN